MKEDQEIAALSVETLVANIASNRLTPGAGSAGAVSLALAAACAMKAVAISLKHHPAETHLERAADVFKNVARLALTDADRDAAAFAAFVHSHTASNAAQLVGAGEHVKWLIDTLRAALDQVEAFVEPTMSGDLLAARALADAALAIQASNQDELQSSQRGRAI
jgi:precorrin-6B methylase 2